MIFMRHRLATDVYIFLSIIALSSIVLILSNLIFENNIFYYIARAVFTLPLILFLSGFPFIYLIFGDEMDFSEFIILSIGMSISITILDAMIVHFTGFPINVTSILNSISITTIIITSIAILKSFIVPKRNIPE